MPAATEEKPSVGVSVKVALRVRPLLKRENVKRCKECLYVLPNRNQVVVGKDQNFTFDYVFGNTSSQSDVYNESVSPLMDACFEGYNATVFAYGQTGAGKTFTIDGDPTNIGVIPRAATHLFDHIKEQSTDTTTYQVKVSYLEIYLEEVKDLLRPGGDDEIHIREDDKGNTIVQGVSEVEVSSAEELLLLMKMGISTRTTGATLMNQQSSRSHAILTLYLNKRAPTTVRNVEGSSTDLLRRVLDKPALAYDYEITSAKFHFVDLAGSERAHRTGNVGERFKESVHINSGLLALGNVISALSDSKRKSSHIPYRDSKITRLLKDSLGGNSRTLMITCVSPANDSFEETLNSLKYAKRARNIRNCPIVNKDYEEIEMKRMESEILQLREQLKTREKSTGSTGSSDNAQVESLMEEKSLLTSEVEDCRALLNLCQSEIERSLHRKSLSLLAPLMEKLKFREFADARSSSHLSVFGDDELDKVREELNQCRSDLANDEEIFAEQQKDMEELKSVMSARTERYEDQVKQLKAEINKLQRITTQSIEVDSRLNSTLTNKVLPKSLITKPCTMSEVHEMIKQKTFTIFERNLKHCLKAPPKTSPPCSRERPSPRVCTREKPGLSSSNLMSTFVVRESTHEGLKEELAKVLEKNRALSEEIEKNSGNDRSEVGKKAMEKNVSNLKKQKSDLEKKLKVSESEVLKLQTKMKKDKLVSLGREKINPARAKNEGTATGASKDSCMNTSQHFTPSKEKIEWLEAEIQSVLNQRGALKEQEEELRRREEAINEKEHLVQEVNKLKCKEVRASQVMSNDLLRMSMKLETLTTDIKDREQALSKTQTLSNSVNIEKDLRKMNEKREKLKKTITGLTEKMVGTALTEVEREELRELQEAIEIINIAINYRTSLINTSMAAPSEDITQLIPALDEQTSQKVIQSLFNKLIEAKEEALKADDNNKLLNLQLEGQQHEMKALQTTFTDAQKVMLTNKSSESSKQLEKDVEYYKMLAKELKQKLRATQGQGLSGDVTASTAGVLTPVRKSKKELRPITAEEVCNRSSTAFG